MKKIFWILLAVIGVPVVAGAVLLASTLIKNNSDLNGIEVGFKPFKTSYCIGESFESKGLTVKALHKDGTKETLASNQYKIDAPKFDKVGEETVVIKYERHKTKLKVNVTKEPIVEGIRLDTENVNQYFLKDAEFSKANSGVVVYEILSDGTERVSRKCEFSSVDTSTTGKKTVTVTCGAFSETYEIDVVFGLHFVPVDPEYNESEFMYLNWGSEEWAPPKSSVYHRSADGDKVSDDLDLGAYFVYYIDFGSQLSKAIINAQVRLQSQVDVSFDNVHYQTVYMPLFTNDITEQKFDLAALLDGVDGNLDFNDNQGAIYIRFCDPSMDDGFGADLYDFEVYYDLVDSSLYKEPKGYYSDSHELVVKVDTASEKEFLYAEEGSVIGDNQERGRHRFNNAPDSYIIYGVDFKNKVKNLDVQISMQGQIKLEASIDGVNWKTICDYKEYAPYGRFTYSLAGMITNFANNNGKLYLKFTDSDNDGAMGADVFDLTFKYSFAGDSTYKKPTGIPYVDLDGIQRTDYRLEFVPYSDAEEIFLYDFLSTGKMSDDAGVFRFTDGVGSYIVYGMDLGGKIEDASLRLKLGQKFQKVEVSFDGQTWSTLLNKDDNLGVKNHKFNLDSVKGYANNNGIVFVRLSPGDGYEGAFGVTLYNLCLDYNLATGVAYKEPTGVTNIGSGSKHNLSFKAFTDTESKFLLENSGTGKMSDDNGDFRFIDGQGAYFTYGIDVGSQMKTARINTKAAQMYQKLEVSFDGANWNTLLNTGSNIGAKNYNYDLTSVSGFAGNTGKVYVRFSGGDGYTGGFGITVYDFGLTYELIDEELYKEPTGIENSSSGGSADYSLTFKPFTNVEEEFLFENNGTGQMSDGDGFFRFIDGQDAYFTYGIDVGSQMSTANITVRAAQQYQKIEASFDGSTWNTLLNISGNAGYKNYSYKLDDIDGFAGNTGEIYVRFSGGVGYTGSFGITVHNFELNYGLKDDGLYKDPTGIGSGGVGTEYNLTFKPFTTAESTFLLENSGTGEMSDGTGKFRFIDGQGAYFTYGINVGSQMSTASIDVKAAQTYQKIEVSFDGTTWNTLLDIGNNAGVKKYSYDLTDITGFTGNTGKVYVKFSGGAGYTGGFGITVYEFGLNYALVNDELYTEPTGIIGSGSGSEESTERNLTFNPFTTVESIFLLENNGTGQMSDSDGTFRFIDGQGAYFTYGINVGSQMSEASISVKAAQKYQKIEVSFDGTTWNTLLNIGNNAGVKNYSYELTEVTGFAGNDGKVYVRFSGGEGYTGGFGITVYEFGLNYKLVDDELYTEPTGITNGGSGSEESTQHSLTFAPFTTAENKFLLENSGTGQMSDGDGTFRFIDGQGAYFIYGIDVGSQMSEASISVKAAQKYQKIEVSFDGTTWNTLLDIGNNMGVKNYTYDLIEVSGFTGNDGKVYVRLSGGAGYTGGFGITVYEFGLTYKLNDEDLYQEPTGITSGGSGSQENTEHSLSFTPFTTAESTFLLENSGTGQMSDSDGTFRFIDGVGAYFTYGIDVGSQMSEASIKVKAAQMYQKIEVSFDGTTWNTLLNIGDNIGAKNYTYDLTSISGFVSNIGKVYVRFSGGEGYNGGFGITVYEFGLTYKLEEEDLYQEPIGITGEDSEESTEYSLTFGAFTTAESTYLIENSETGQMSDSDGTFRFINTKNAYFTYGIDVGSQMSEASIQVKASQKYQKIEVSFDGTTWNTLLNIGNNAGVKNYTYDLTEVSGFSGNIGKVYVRFSGGEGYTGSFGITVYEFGLTYELVDENLYEDPKAAS